jgi:hypothetical protein
VRIAGWSSERDKLPMKRKRDKSKKKRKEKKRQASNEKMK